MRIRVRTPLLHVLVVVLLYILVGYSEFQRSACVTAGGGSAVYLRSSKKNTVRAFHSVNAAKLGAFWIFRKWGKWRPLVNLLQWHGAVIFCEKWGLKGERSGCDTKLFRKHNGAYLTIILRNRAEYHLILRRRGRRPSWLKSDDIPRDWTG